MIGLNNGENNTKEIHEHGHYKALFAQRSISIPLLHQGRRQYRQLTNTLYEDNPYFHSEPYGYLMSDDVKYFNKIIIKNNFLKLYKTNREKLFFKKK